MTVTDVPTVPWGAPAQPHTGEEREGPTLALPVAYNLKVGDVMNRRPVTVEPTASLWDALVLMRTHNITGLPVVNEAGRLSGVLSQTDIAASLAGRLGLPAPVVSLDLLLLHRASGGAPSLDDLRKALEEVSVAEAMSRPPIFVGPECILERAMQRMAEAGIHRLPVVEGFRLIGIVTPDDLLRATLRAGPRYG